ncbi:histidine kinase [Aquimarina gracilis]|uniref:Histidine kinase n=1 Tax=Aquimarina gracilis TaxID=874422 RepID=A0ABU5ZWH5_9FLAO|nr:histidine kinase [Aquimarina gracilis]MEB3346212.1 histidine kinase [Aquimarina gracilis]
MNLKKTSLQKSVEILLNIIFWVASIIILLKTTQTGIIENVIEDENGKIIQETIEMGPFALQNFIGMIAIIPIFYLTAFYLTSKFYATKKYLLYVLYLFLGVVFLISLELIIVSFQRYVLHSMMIRFFLFYNLFFMAIAVVYGIIRHQLKMESHQETLEKEKIKAELKLMQSQINPHFMFNALNNLLAISERSDTPETSSGITQLSDLLRFMIYDTQAEKILLSKEIEFIQNFISLQQLRYTETDPLTINFDVITNNFNPNIAPTLLVPFVENAFKHGIDIQSESFVNIQLKVLDNTLHFEVKNSKHHSKRTEFDKKYSGIGLENVKKRLNLIYPNTHNLDIIQDEHTFFVKLNIDLV